MQHAVHIISMTHLNTVAPEGGLMMLGPPRVCVATAPHTASTSAALTLNHREIFSTARDTVSAKLSYAFSARMISVVLTSREASAGHEHNGMGQTLVG